MVYEAVKATEVEPSRNKLLENRVEAGEWNMLDSDQGPWKSLPELLSKYQCS